MARVQTPQHLRREYECVYLIDQALDEGQVDKTVQHYRDVVTENGGKVVKLDNWGSRKLAYDIDRQSKATYIYMQFLGTSGLVHELERTMRLSEEVVRFMTVVLDDDVDPNARPEASEVSRRVAEDEGEARTEAASRTETEEEEA